MAETIINDTLHDAIISVRKCEVSRPMKNLVAIEEKEEEETSLLVKEKEDKDLTEETGVHEIIDEDEAEEQVKEVSKKSTKRKSLFRKLKAVSEEEIPCHEDENVEKSIPQTPKVNRKRFSFGSKKLKKSVTNATEAKDETLEGKENKAAEQCITMDETPLLIEQVYTGPDSKENEMPKEMKHETPSIEENNQGEKEHEVTTNEIQKKVAVSKIPVKKFRKLYWKRMSTTTTNDNQETPEITADSEESQLAVAEDVTIEDTTQGIQVNEDSKEDEITVSKKQGKSRRLLKWKRLSRSIDESNLPKYEHEKKIESEEPQEVSTQTTSEDNCYASFEQEEANEDETSVVEETNDEIPQESGDEVLQKKKNTRKTKRLSWKRFGWNGRMEKSSIISKPLDNTDDECEQNEISIQTENETGNTIVIEEPSVVQLELLEEAPQPVLTTNAVTPVDSDSTPEAEYAVDNSLEQSVLTQVTQLIENNEDEIKKATSTNPFLSDDESTKSFIEVDATTSKKSEGVEDKDKTMDFVLVDEYTNKPLEESFYLTKNALKVYNKAHLAQHYCQPCCNLM